MSETTNAGPITITIDGPVSQSDQDRLFDQVTAALAHSPRHVRGAELRMVDHQRSGPGPQYDRPARIEAGLHLDGHPIRAHVAADDMDDAIASLIDRIERQLRDLAGRDRDRERRPLDPSTWNHGDPPTHQPPYFPRPADEREIVRHKSFALDPLDPAEAATAMLDGDYVFFLYVDRETGSDHVIFRNPDGGMGIDEHPAPLTATEAKERLDVGAEPFVFHQEPNRDRPAVLYRRYDGHYGRITPRDS